ncbi:murein DD-endopeptidase MepM/ murein hydrolase activator NlpD [Dyadobacter sp. BE34]|uniref:Murein DD-endopeptidase MepM/ murein hydrolase activator NlpD n=1 Tax=Dyadobacter fermentans TaxID=94254 RepID=A0ABU1R7I7_9BACT|nr:MULTISPECIES: peptidoglycan DD-metalloendopeptidase family protein [Dyadobacter]MDR6809369.1 murein DD-endopeptidase MepM/ murein hydrolase activator NlpD [Dyadobacter fermentans]MDR7047037.1 murein DD-endopeptidase MepM/ murein hydrolase activator NlpD [Dyadobacter sp. BE242]MDR7194996.1 murein DD-endopeptidase MepM/ murein hydrolase activator NlpD [Dyadobacter sp. BE34]MDR7214459.1 murein DD-endopeptidase MepM/ murein hydrolase activator NlpD [Dyadobacter sp. BE31]MDR7266918.1 murein DD-e
MSELARLLRAYPAFSPIVQNGKPYRKLDFTAANSGLLTRDLSETVDFSNYVFDELLSGSAFNGIGGYGEDRVIYRHRKHFTTDAEKPRSIHLGVDIWAEAGTPLYAPLDATVHSFAFNNHYGDYGPTIILTHELDGITFFTLYGHLSLTSLEGLHEGKPIQAGEHIATIGPYPENGDWPPHLHFQVIRDMGNLKGDFPGVCNAADRDYYLNLCPDPELILRIKI